jgi:hypothetical protein
MRQRDERIDNAHHKTKGEVLYDKRAGLQPIKLYRPGDFQFHGDLSATCPAGQTLTSNGSLYTHTSGAKVQQCRCSPARGRLQREGRSSSPEVRRSVRREGRSPQEPCVP